MIHYKNFILLFICLFISASAYAEPSPQDKLEQITRELKLNGFSQINNAITDLNELLVVSPDFLPALIAVANSLQIRYQYGNQDVEDIKQSLVYLNRVIELDSTQLEAYQRRALAFLNLNEIEKAQQDIDTALKLNSGNADLWLLKIESFLAQGSTEQAVEAAKLALSEKLDVEDKAYIIGEVFYAAQYWQQALRFFGLSKQESSKLLLAKGFCYENLQQYDNAIAEYQKAISTGNESIAILLRLAALQLRTKNSQAAHATVRDLMKVDAENIQAWRLSALVYEQQANVFRAKAAWAKVKQMSDSEQLKTYYDEAVERMQKLSEFH